MAPTHTVLDPPVGPLTLVAEDGALTALLMGRHRHPGLALGPAATRTPVPRASSCRSTSPAG